MPYICGSIVSLLNSPALADVFFTSEPPGTPCPQLITMEQNAHSFLCFRGRSVWSHQGTPFPIEDVSVYHSRVL